MFRLVLAASAVACVASDCATEYDQFLISHPDKVRSPERFAIFCTNLARVDQHNSANASYSMRLHTFSDWTLDELAMLLGDTKPNSSQNAAPVSVPSAFKPANSVDWRSKMPAVKYQGQCGSCWAFSAIAVVDFFGGSHSEQQLLDCSRGTCKGYNPYYALQYLAGNGGSDFESHYPYKATKGSCRRVHARTMVSNVRRIRGASSILSAVQNQVVSVSITLSSRGPFMHYSAGVFDHYCGSGEGHAVAIVGYQRDYWIVRNSWGSRWGQAGHVYFKKGVDLCSIESRGPVIADISHKMNVVV